jgi:hypothetical protein
MCTYCGTINYRKIYQNHYGPIPKDSYGRSFDIHHLDGNHHNNSPENLKTVALQEHYDIHYFQQDYAACLYISHRLAMSPEEQSRLASLQNKKRVENKTHNFLGKSNPSHTRVKNGTHNFQDSGAALTRNNKRINEGTHIFLGGKIQSQTANRQLQNGRHPSQLKKTCEYCGITCGSGQYNQWHGDKCKLRFKPFDELLLPYFNFNFTRLFGL